MKDVIAYIKMPIWRVCAEDKLTEMETEWLFFAPSAEDAIFQFELNDSKRRHKVLSVVYVPPRDIAGNVL